jgi:hypothetical protein
MSAFHALNRNQLQDMPHGRAIGESLDYDHLTDSDKVGYELAEDFKNARGVDALTSLRGRVAEAAQKLAAAHQNYQKTGVWDHSTFNVPNPRGGEFSKHPIWETTNWPKFWNDQGGTDEEFSPRALKSMISRQSALHARALSHIDTRIANAQNFQKGNIPNHFSSLLPEDLPEDTQAELVTRGKELNNPGTASILHPNRTDTSHVFHQGTSLLENDVLDPNKTGTNIDKGDVNTTVLNNYGRDEVLRQLISKKEDGEAKGNEDLLDKHIAELENGGDYLSFYPISNMNINQYRRTSEPTSTMYAARTPYRAPYAQGDELKYSGQLRPYASVTSPNIYRGANAAGILAPRDTNPAAAAIFERIATRNEAQEPAIANAMTVMSGGKYKPVE